MAASPINVLNFDHAALVVSDLEKTEHFYINVLGMKKATRPAFDFGGAWYQIGSTLLHIILANDDAGLPGPCDHRVKKITRGQHLAFNVSDFDQAMDLLQQHGIEIAAGPKQRPDGTAQVYVRDPDGHLIELCAVPG